MNNRLALWTSLCYVRSCNYTLILLPAHKSVIHKVHCLVLLDCRFTNRRLSYLRSWNHILVCTPIKMYSDCITCIDSIQMCIAAEPARVFILVRCFCTTDVAQLLTISAASYLTRAPSSTMTQAVC